MTKDTFLTQIEIIRDRVNWTQVAKDLDKNVRTIMFYLDGERNKSEMMSAILEAAKNQLETNGTADLQLAATITV